MVIALCLNSEEIERAMPTDLALFERCPGAGWVGALRELTDLEVLPYYEVARRLYEHRLEPKDVLVIQEEGNINGISLIGQGCIAWINYCMESPLYAPQFYADIEKYKAQFMHCLYFDWKGGGKNVHPMYFPSFSGGEIVKHTEPRYRFMTCIMSNKFISSNHPDQLHGARLNTLMTFLGRPGFDLYGRGWPEGSAQEIAAKGPVMRNYRFALCYENYASPGYITEKIIHAMVHGCIPIYLGAPDISDYVDRDSFVDARGVSCPAELWRWCSELQEENQDYLREAAWDWLNTSGQHYTYKAFAERVVGLIP